MNNILLKPFDPFKDAEEQETVKFKGFVDIRFFQKSARSRLTTIEGLPKTILPNLLKTFKQTLSCNGNVEDTDKLGSVLHLQGDHRESVAKYLVSEEIAKKSNIRIHG